MTIIIESMKVAKVLASELVCNGVVDETIPAREKEQMIMASLSKLSTFELVELFTKTDMMFCTPELAMVRGWIMDVLELRHMTEFLTWLNNENYDTPMWFFFKNTDTMYTARV